MKRKTSPDYGRIFKLTAFRYLPHHTLLVLARIYNSERLAAYLDGRVRRKLGSGSMPVPDPDLLQAYVAIAGKTVFWHGTGRLQYTANGEVVDKLEAIVRGNALTPAHDVYSIVLAGKEMETLSATTVRIIARSYADTHGRGLQEAGRYGSSLWWVSYYYSLCYAEIIIKYSPLMIKNWRAFKRASTNRYGERTWGKKVHSQAKSVWDTFGLGSDIPGNYPVLFGIREAFDIVPLPESMRKWEVRIASPVSLADITHIEVPEHKVDEVRRLLSRHGYAMPVFAVELGEYVASRQPLVDLLRSK